MAFLLSDLCPMRLSEAIDLLDHPALRAVAPHASPTNPAAAAAPASPATPANPSTPLRWADLGCGTGLFTEALAHFLPAASTIYGLDLHPALHHDRVNDVSLIPVHSDFINIPLPLDNLDGILMANSLHYVKDKPQLLQQLKTHLRPHSPLLIVEYDTDRPVATWVPWPISYTNLQPLLAEAGWPHIQKLGERPSAYGRSNIYAALARPS